MSLKNTSKFDVLNVLYWHSKYPELFQWFKEFLGYKDSSPMESVASFKERTSGELHHLEIGMTVLAIFVSSLGLELLLPECSKLLCMVVMNFSCKCI